MMDVRAARRALATVAFERRLNVETEGIVPLSDFGLEHPDRVVYTPSPWRDFRRALPRHDVGDDDVFLDLGAGMGRILVLAARYPFKRVIGVELAPELAAIARRNLASARLRRRVGDTEVITADATTYVVPDDVTVVYLFNPFTGET